MTDYQYHLLELAAKAASMQPVDQPLLLEGIGAAAALGLLGATKLRTDTLPQIVHARMYAAEHDPSILPNFAAVYELPEGRKIDGCGYVVFAMYPPEVDSPAQAVLLMLETEQEAKRLLVNVMLEGLEYHWSGDLENEYRELGFEDYLEDLLELNLPFRSTPRFTTWERILDERANDRAHWDDIQEARNRADY